MSSCLPCHRFQPEAIKLVWNCYPTTTAQEVANSSAVSFLCFFANNHPSKLPSVVKELERRIRNDHAASRTVQVKVGLEIVSGLCAECPTHFARFGKTVITIFLSLVNNSAVDNDIFVATMETFTAFSKHYDHSALDLEDDFRRSYTAMLNQCQKGCLTDQPNLSKRNRTRLASLKAIHAVLAHISFDNTADLEEYLEIIMPALLASIQLPVDPSREPADGPVPATSIVSKEAESCLIETMQSVNAANLWRTMRPFYKTTEVNRILYTDPARAEYILDTCVANVNPIYRPAMVDVAVKRLLNVTNKQLNLPNEPLTRQGQLTLIRMLTKTISTGGLAVGVTVLELVDSLTQLLYKSIGDIVSTRDGEGKRITAQERADMEQLEDALVKCIGSLAISVYYPTQINDIVGFIVNRLKIQSLPIAERVEAQGTLRSLSDAELVLLEVRKGLVRCLRQVMENTVSGSQSSGVRSQANLPTDDLGLSPPTDDATTRRTSVSDGASNISEPGSGSWSASVVRRVPVPEELVTPMVVFLQSPDMDLRVEFGLFLYYYLTDAAELRDGSAIYTFNSKQLRYELHSALYRIPFLHYILPADVAIAYLTAVSLLQKYGANELMEAVPLTFAIQDRASSELTSDAQIARRNVIFGIVTRYYEQVAREFNSTKLQYAVLSRLKASGGTDWLVSFTSVAKIEELRGKDWSEAPAIPQFEPMERSVVVHALETGSSVPPRQDLKEVLGTTYDPNGPLLPDPEPLSTDSLSRAEEADSKPTTLSAAVLEAISAVEPTRSPPPNPVLDVNKLKRALDVSSEVRAISPVPSNNLSTASNTSPANSRGRGQDSETNSLTHSNVSVARLEKKKVLSAEAATLLASLTGPYQIGTSGNGVFPRGLAASTSKVSNGPASYLTPTPAGAISLGNLPVTRPTSGDVKLTVNDFSPPPIMEDSV